VIAIGCAFEIGGKAPFISEGVLLSSKISNTEIKTKNKVCLQEIEGDFLSLSPHPVLEAYCDMTIVTLSH